MTLYTKANLRDQALTDLGVLDPTETADADTIAHLDPIIQQVIESLDDENCLIFDPSVSITTANIPGRVMQGMQDAVTARIGPSYGRQKSKAEQEQDWRLALGKLRRAVLEGSNDIPVVIENF